MNDWASGPPNWSGVRMTPDEARAWRQAWAARRGETYQPGQLGAVERNIFDDDHDMSYYSVRPRTSTTRNRPGSMKRQTPKRRKVVFVRDGFACRDCGRKFEHPEPYDGEVIKGLTLGHITPRSWGGSFKVENLIAQCGKCNSKLGDRLWTEGWQDAKIDPDAR